MKRIFKELFRYKSSTLLNAVGLSTAFATFIIISMQIRYDFAYDRYNENYHSIYKIGATDTIKGSRLTNFTRPSINTIGAELPEIECITALARKKYSNITIIGEAEKQSLTTDLIHCQSEITNIFTFDFVDGNAEAFDIDNAVMVSEEFAQTWYKDSSAVGKQFSWRGSDYTISAVFKTTPQNSTLKSDIFINMGQHDNYNTSDWNYNAYIKLSKNSTKSDIEAKIRAIIPPDLYLLKNKCVDVIPLSEVRYKDEGFDKNQIYILIAIALAIIILASINFINFATAMVPIKIKAINLKKVVGATSASLRANIIIESVILATISFILALALVELFKTSELNSVIADTSWASNKIIYIIAFVVMLVTSTVSGLYPAFYSTSFNPAIVLKSSYAMSASGITFRKILIGFQFFITLVFISLTIFIQLQHNFLINRDGGYTKEGIIHVYSNINSHHNDIRNTLLQNPIITDVTFSRNALGTQNITMSWGRSYSKGKFNILCFPVDHNFLDFFDIKILDGRNFKESDTSSENGYYIMSESAMDKYQFTEGEKVAGHSAPTDIIGVYKDIHITNMKVNLEPSSIYIFGKYPWGQLEHAYIKASGDSQQAIEYIRDSYKKLDPNAKVHINYLPFEIEIAYTDENSTKMIMQSFSLIAIIIALLGVFGLVMFDTRFRRKEIGLRRINGATVDNILKMFSISYIKIIVISFVLSVPVVYFMISEWLTIFPYKIDVYWWVFILAFAMVLVLTITISTVQTLRAARENPINAIK